MILLANFVSEAHEFYSIFYQKIAKLLLSMRTVGSIDVEHRIKPVKHEIITKKRYRPKDPKGTALYRALENIRHLIKAKKIINKKITDPLLYSACTSILSR